MATNTTEPTRIGDVVKMETDWHFGRQKHTIEQDGAATEALVVGELLENSGGKEVVVATGSSCNAILLEPVSLADLIAGDTERVCLVRGPAVIDSDQVNVASAQKATALVALLALNIVSRTEPTYTTL